MSTVRLRLATSVPCEVRVGPGVLDEIGELVADRRTVVLSDRNVAPLHAHRLGRLAEGPVLAVEPGEAAKSFAVLERVLDYLVEAGLDRGSVLVTLGGGVVGDLGGLAAALFMRGIDVVHAPTTLLAQSDAAIGGKTAVNLAGGKNLAGAFHGPRAVFCDPGPLATLPPQEIRAGLGEVLKTAVVGDPELLGLLEERGREVVPTGADPALLTEIVARCVRVKGAVVERDEREAGERKQLNLGHTFAHAIERAAGFGVIPHGLAVGTGVGLALEASSRLGVLADEELRGRFERLAAGLELCPTLPALRERFATALPAEELLRGMRHDKKGSADRTSLVLVQGIGALTVDNEVDPGFLLDLLG